MILSIVFYHICKYIVIYLYLVYVIDSISDNQFHYDSFHNDTDNNLDIFWNGINESILLQLIHEAESNIRIFIYPIPLDVLQVNASDKYCHKSQTSTCVPLIKRLHMKQHFQIEYLFIEYLQQFQSNQTLLNSLSINDPRRYMIVNESHQANAFIINHQILRIINDQCGPGVQKRIWSKHIIPIIDHMKLDYPYFNKSYGGHDHFFISMYDFGIFCGHLCDVPNKRLELLQLRNVSFIGNYGMDELHYYKEKKKFHGNSGKHIFNSNSFAELIANNRTPCHRVGKDIVIPQIINTKSFIFYQKYINTHLSHREYDSMFTGHSFNHGKKPDRHIIDLMLKEQQLNQTSYYSENFHGNITREGFPDHSLIGRAYFMYNPCGVSCWSQVRSFFTLIYDKYHKHLLICL